MRSAIKHNKTGHACICSYKSKYHRRVLGRRHSRLDSFTGVLPAGIVNLHAADGCSVFQTYFNTEPFFEDQVTKLSVWIPVGGSVCAVLSGVAWSSLQLPRAYYRPSEAQSLPQVSPMCNQVWERLVSRVAAEGYGASSDGKERVGGGVMNKWLGYRGTGGMETLRGRGALRRYGALRGTEVQTVRSRTEIERKTSFYGRNNLLLWRSSRFTKYLTKIPAVLLTIHEVGRKIVISVFFSWFKETKAKRSRQVLFSSAVSHSQLL